jgi:hypothetical protein
MLRHSHPWAIALTIVAGAALPLATVTAAGEPQQAAQKAAPRPKPSWDPRTSWGAPDLQGVWSFATVTPLQRPEGVTKEFLTAQEIFQIEKKAVAEATDEARGADAARDVAGAYNDFWWDRGTRVAGRRTALIVDPADGRMPPLTPAAKKYADSPEALKVQETRRGMFPAASWEDTDLWDRCLTRGLPIVPGPYNNNIQIVQTESHLVVHHEMIHDARVIPISKAAHLPAAIPQWMGSSRASWDGDTLVVVTKNFSAKQELPFEPRMSAEHMTLTERFSRLDDGSLMYEFTVDDPKIYTRPWTARLQLVKTDGALFEYACHEANYSMEGILKGSRVIEAAAEGGAQKSR